MRTPNPLQKFLQKDEVWWNYYQKHIDDIRPAVAENIVKVLSCGAMVRGYTTFECSNDECPHFKKVTHSCKSRFCPTCGKKATDVWVAEQREILPQTDWQHITLTMPCELWGAFEQDRELINCLPKIAANIFLEVAEKKGIKPAIFAAIHTFGRDLKWNVHIHLSITMGGLSTCETYWKNIRFAKKVIMPMWRYRVINMLREAKEHRSLDVDAKCLERQYHRPWIVHFAKPTHDPWHNVAYLGRYLKRPPCSYTRLAHYQGNDVAFQYRNHHTGQYDIATFEKEEFIARLTQHIPDKGFRMIRYYGILANRVRSKYLPIVYELLGQVVKPQKFIGWVTLMKNAFNHNPLKCILCNSDMRYAGITFGLPLNQLLDHHQKLATQKPIIV